MAAAGGGVILHLNSGSARGQAPLMGGTGSADGATEALMRNLAMELGPQGGGCSASGRPASPTR